MKDQLLILLILCLFSNIQAQNYSLILPHQESHFLGTDNEVFTLRIDSIYSMGDSVIYQNHNVFFTDLTMPPPCVAKVADSSWIGSKIILDNSNGEQNYYFYNASGTLQMTIKSLAGLNQPWIFTSFGNGDYIQAVVSSIVYQNVLGTMDSVKVISLQAKNVINANMPHSFNGPKIRISKNNGIIQLFNMLDFPSDINSYDLIGASNPDRGIVNLTAREIYDYNVGDEFHTEKQTQTVPWEYTRSIRKKLILTKNISQNQDTITYTYERCEMTYASPQMDTTYYFDTLSEIIILSELERLHKLNDEPIMDFAGPAHFLMDYSYATPKRKKGTSEVYSYNSASHCFEVVFGFAVLNKYYLEGLGGEYHEWEPTILTSDYNRLMYYKKGNETWGTPLALDCDSIRLAVELVENHDAIKIFPNPFSTTTNITIEDFNATDNWQLELLDITGKKILSTKIMEQTLILERNNLPIGMYIYKILNTQKQKEYVGKLLVN